MTNEDIIKALSEFKESIVEMQKTVNELVAQNNQANTQVTDITRIADTSRFNLSDAARILNIDRKTLSRHADNGLIRCSYSRASKRRIFYGYELKKYYKSV